VLLKRWLCWIEVPHVVLGWIFCAASVQIGEHVVFERYRILSLPKEIIPVEDVTEEMATVADASNPGVQFGR